MIAAADGVRFADRLSQDLKKGAIPLVDRQFLGKDALRPGENHRQPGACPG